MKELYNIDMEKDQYSKLLSDIPDPTGKSDEVFIDTIHAIEHKILSLRENR